MGKESKIITNLAQEQFLGFATKMCDGLCNSLAPIDFEIWVSEKYVTSRVNWHCLFQFNGKGNPYGREDDLKSCRNGPQDTKMGPNINQGSKLEAQAKYKRREAIGERY